MHALHANPSDHITVFDVVDALGYVTEEYQLQLDWIKESRGGWALLDGEDVARSIKVSSPILSQFTVH